MLWGMMDIQEPRKFVPDVLWPYWVTVLRGSVLNKSAASVFLCVGSLIGRYILFDELGTWKKGQLQLLELKLSHMENDPSHIINGFLI